MQTDKERFPALVLAFEKAIVDQIKAQNPDGSYVPNTANLMAAAWPAMKEVVESEVEPVGPLLAVNIWRAVMLSNESAFHQGLERDIKVGLVSGIKLVKKARAVAAKYME